MEWCRNDETDEVGHLTQRSALALVMPPLQSARRGKITSSWSYGLNVLCLVSTVLNNVGKCYLISSTSDMKKTRSATQLLSRASQSATWIRQDREIRRGRAPFLSSPRLSRVDYWNRVVPTQRDPRDTVVVTMFCSWGSFQPGFRCPLNTWRFHTKSPCKNKEHPMLWAITFPDSLQASLHWGMLGLRFKLHCTYPALARWGCLISQKTWNRYHLTPRKLVDFSNQISSPK